MDDKANTECQRRHSVWIKAWIKESLSMVESPVSIEEIDNGPGNDRT